MVDCLTKYRLALLLTLLLGRLLTKELDCVVKVRDSGCVIVHCHQEYPVTSSALMRILLSSLSHHSHAIVFVKCY